MNTKYHRYWDVAKRVKLNPHQRTQSSVERNHQNHFQQIFLVCISPFRTLHLPKTTLTLDFTPMRIGPGMYDGNFELLIKKPPQYSMGDRVGKTNNKFGPGPGAHHPEKVKKRKGKKITL